MRKIFLALSIITSLVFLNSCKGKEYEVRFFDYNDNIIEELVIKKGKEIDYTSEPQREGYTFISWDKEFTQVNEDIDFKAVYEINEYTVIFKDFDGKVLETLEINYKGNAIPNITPTRVGYDFIGWDRDLTDVKEDFEVRAIYEIKTYKVEFESETGKLLFRYVVNHGDLIDKPDLVLEGKIKEYEYYYNEEVYNFDTPITKDITIISKPIYEESNFEYVFDENIKLSSITFGEKEIYIKLQFKLGFKIKDYKITNGSLDIQENLLIIYNFKEDKIIKLELESNTYSDLPVVVLDTGGIPITSKDKYVDGTFELFNAGEFNKEELSLEIRGRGNSTWAQPKKPLRLKFNEKQSMFGTPYKEKNWVLLADYLDITHIKNYVAHNLAQKFTDPDEGMLFAPIGVNVNMYFNDEYQGVFLFADHKDDKRMGVEMEVDESMDEFPFYLEMDDYANQLKPDEFFTVLLNGSARHFDIKYPEPKHRIESNPKLQYNYIKKYIEDVEYAVRNLDDYESLIDVRSFVDFYLINQFMENTEVSFKSVHMVKRNGEKLRLGPVWDFDWGVGGAITSFEKRSPNYENYSDVWSGYSTTWWNALIKDSNFNTVVKERWDLMNPEITEILESLPEYRNHIKNDVYRELNDWNRYPNTVNPLLTFSGQYNYVIKRLTHRQAWMDKEISNMN